MLSLNQPVLTQTHEMSLTISDLERLLPKVKNIENINKNNDLYDFLCCEKKISIEIKEVRDKKLGSINFPVLILQFNSYTDDEVIFKTFMSEFFKTFQREGG